LQAAPATPVAAMLSSATKIAAAVRSVVTRILTTN
jgi:hypothetical protein